MLSIITWIGLVSYSVGCAVSQSLLSLGGTALVAATFAVFACSKDARKKRDYLVIHLASLAWISFTFLDLIFHPWDDRSWHSLGNIPLLLVPLAFYPLNRVQNKSRIVQLVDVLFGIAILASLARSLTQAFRGEEVVSFFSNPIYLAYSLLPAFLYYSERFFRKNEAERTPKIALLLVALAALFIIILSNNRMTLAVAALYLLFRLACLLKRSRGSRQSLLWGFVFLLLFGALAASRPRLISKITLLFHGEDPSWSLRLVAWKYNWGLFLEHPLIGVGLEKNGIDTALTPNFGVYSRLWTPGHLYFAHSVYLQALSEGGVIGLGLFLAFWILYIARNPRTWMFFAMMALAGLTENIFNNSKALHPFLFFAMMMNFVFPVDSRGELHE